MTPQERFDLESAIRALRDATNLLTRAGEDPDATLSPLPARRVGQATGRVVFAADLLEKLVRA